MYAAGLPDRYEGVYVGVDDLTSLGGTGGACSDTAGLLASALDVWASMALTESSVFADSVALLASFLASTGLIASVNLVSPFERGSASLPLTSEVLVVVTTCLGTDSPGELS